MLILMDQLPIGRSAPDAEKRVSTLSSGDAQGFHMTAIKVTQYGAIENGTFSR
jgi:hypothetical protein